MFFLFRLEDLVCQRIFNGLVHIDLIYEQTAAYRREMKIRDKMATVLLRILGRKKTEVSGKGEAVNFLDRLLSMKVNDKALNDAQLVENLINVLIGVSIQLVTILTVFLYF